MEAKEEELKQWVLSNMRTEAGSELDLYKEQVAKFVSLTATGEVIFNVDRTKLDGSTEILLLLMGKAYARIAGLSPTDVVTNKELVKLVKGSASGQRWALTRLTQGNLIASAGPGAHHILPSQVGRALKEIGEKIGE